MSREPVSSEPELLRALREEPLPGSADDASPSRRDRLVRAMKDAVERTAEQLEKDRRFRRIAYGLAAAASFAILSGLLLKDQLGRHQHANIADIDQVTGTVVLTQEGARRVLGTGERVVHDGDALQTAAGAQARLATGKSSINVGESTELRLSQPSGAEERISLRRGRVDVAVDKAIETKRAVVVETPDAEVVVRGTVFDVRVEPSGGATTTHVHVTRGSVWVLSQGVQVALLSTGQSWSSAGGVAAAPPTVLADPLVPVAPVEAAPAATPPKPSVAPAVKDTAPRKAGTLTEENKLFAAGVEARNRGDAARAAELFGELLSSYPQSALREAAQVERFRALSRAGLAGRAASEARRYLAEHADGFARSEARDLALDSKK
jgi:hypothetical protein